MSHTEISWDQPIDINSKTTKSASNVIWFKKKEGDNIVRIVTKLYPYLAHQIKKNPQDKNDFGVKVLCSKVNGEGSCPACDMYEADKTQAKLTKRYYIGVINRSTGAYEIMDCSGQEVQKIQSAFPSGKSPLNADLIIKYNKRQVDPSLKTMITRDDPSELSAVDQRIKDNVDLEELKKRTAPIKPEWVQARIDKVLGVAVEQQKANNNIKAQQMQKKPVVKQAASFVVDDGDADFPDFN